MYYTYILESLGREQRRYIGFTKDLRRRLDYHNRGKCPHTSRYRPWKVSVYIAFDSKELAVRFERYLKSGSGYAFAKRHF